MCKIICISLSLSERENVLMPENICELFTISAEDRDIFNANINVNKQRFDLRKIKRVEIKCILEIM